MDHLTAELHELQKNPILATAIGRVVTFAFEFFQSQKLDFEMGEPSTTSPRDAIESACRNEGLRADYFIRLFLHTPSPFEALPESYGQVAWNDLQTQFGTSIGLLAYSQDKPGRRPFLSANRNLTKIRRIQTLVKQICLIEVIEAELKSASGT
jgi:hypothetical protein